VSRWLEDYTTSSYTLSVFDSGLDTRLSWTAPASISVNGVSLFDLWCGNCIL